MNKGSTNRSSDGLPERKQTIVPTFARMKSRWDAMQFGDFVFFYSKGRFVSVGTLKFKKMSEELALSLWPKSKNTGEPWSCVFFVENVQQINLPLNTFNEITGYEFRAVMGFTQVKKESALENIMSGFESVENFVRSLVIGIQEDDAGELIELAQQPTSDITKDELTKLDSLIRDRSLEDIEYTISLYAQKQMGKTPEQVSKITKSFKRNVGMVNAIKQKFENKCQICGFTFKTSAGTYYSEAAHVIPISKAVEGVDSPDNIWILCANHHKMLDRGAINSDGPHSYIESGIRKDLIVY